MSLRGGWAVPKWYTRPYRYLFAPESRNGTWNLGTAWLDGLFPLPLSGPDPSHHDLATHVGGAAIIDKLPDEPSKSSKPKQVEATARGRDPAFREVFTVPVISLSTQLQAGRNARHLVIGVAYVCSVVWTVLIPRISILLLLPLSDCISPTPSSVDHTSLSALSFLQSSTSVYRRGCWHSDPLLSLSCSYAGFGLNTIRLRLSQSIHSLSFAYSLWLFYKGPFPASMLSFTS